MLLLRFFASRVVCLSLLQHERSDELSCLYLHIQISACFKTFFCVSLHCCVDSMCTISTKNDIVCHFIYMLQYVKARHASQNISACADIALFLSTLFLVYALYTHSHHIGSHWQWIIGIAKVRLCKANENDLFDLRNGKSGGTNKPYRFSKLECTSRAPMKMKMVPFGEEKSFMTKCPSTDDWEPLVADWSLAGQAVVSDSKKNPQIPIQMIVSKLCCCLRLSTPDARLDSKMFTI